jgi:hypothetical protein
MARPQPNRFRRPTLCPPELRAPPDLTLTCAAPILPDNASVRKFEGGQDIAPLRACGAPRRGDERKGLPGLPVSAARTPSWTLRRARARSFHLLIAYLRYVLIVWWPVRLMTSAWLTPPSSAF